MKKIYIILTVSLLTLSACGTRKNARIPYLSIFANKGIPGMIYPEYIILRTHPSVYEMYSPGVYESVWGEWKIRNDTLLLHPKAGFTNRDMKISFLKVTSKDSTMMTIPQQYLVRKNCIIDVTDYSSILPEPFKSQDSKTTYYRISK
jgi:hypothetical protein